MECDGCGEEFDAVVRRPKVLPCGHTLCRRCAARGGRCAADGQEIPDVADLVDNHCVLKLIKTRTTSASRRFYCLTCKKAADPVCLEQHDFCGMLKARREQVQPWLATVQAGAELHEQTVSQLVTLIPSVVAALNGLVDSSVERQKVLRVALDQVENLMDEDEGDAAWLEATRTLEDVARQCEQQHPHLQRQLGLLENRGRCYVELEKEAADSPASHVATTMDLSAGTGLARALRVVLYLLGRRGHLEDVDGHEDGRTAEWEDAADSTDSDDMPRGEGGSGDHARAGGSGGNDEQRRAEISASFLELLARQACQSSASTSTGVRPPPRPRQVRRRAVLRPRLPPNKENYELLKTLDDQPAVVAMQDFHCPICLTDQAAGEGIVLKECLHVFCRDCLSATVEHSEEAAVACPYQDENYSCTSVLTEREIKSLVPAEVYDQHLLRSLKVAEGSMDNTFHCKTVDCEGWCQFEPGVNQFVCPRCMNKNCLQCQVIHDPENCKEYQDRIRRAAETDLEARRTHEALQAMLASGNAMRCPKCTVVIVKQGGCDGLVCAMCELQICWATKQARWGPGGTGDTTGGCRCNAPNRCHPNCQNCH